MAISEVYLSDIEQNDPAYMVRLVAVRKGTSGHLEQDVLHMEVCAVESTFSRTQFTVAGADPKQVSDSGFNHEASMFTFNLDEMIDALQLLKNHGL